MVVHDEVVGQACGIGAGGIHDIDFAVAIPITDKENPAGRRLLHVGPQGGDGGDPALPEPSRDQRADDERDPERQAEDLRA